MCLPSLVFSESDPAPPVRTLRSEVGSGGCGGESGFTVLLVRRLSSSSVRPTVFPVVQEWEACGRSGPGALRLPPP